MLQKHENPQNKFQVLEDNTEEDLNRIVWRSNILRTERKLIKKCHKCNFKKRTCILDPTSCQASQKCCYYCKKKGHFPSSLCCKAKRKIKLMLIKKPKAQRKNQSQKKLSEKMLKFVNIRIQELERMTESNQNPSQFIDVKNYQTMIKAKTSTKLEGTEKDMYDSKHRGSLEFNKQLGSKESILKTAKCCARKFKNESRKRYFSKYCIKKAHKIIQDEPIPNPEEIASMQKVLDVFDKMYYTNETGDKNYGEDQDNFEYLISQLDGQTDMMESSEEEEQVIKKKLFAVNCEIQGISYLMNFFRSFDLLWKSTLGHCLCKSDQKEPDANCFFCHMRSSCLRLNSPRTKGPRNIKILEFTSQLNQYQSQLGCDWRTNVTHLEIDGTHSYAS